MSSVHLVVPAGVDDPTTPSGGNVYDCRIHEGLTTLGWHVHRHCVAGGWPSPGRAARAGLAATLSTIPDRAVVLLDGLVASNVPEALVPESRRLRLVVLVHMPLEEEAARREHAVLSAAGAVVTTSSWTRQRLVDRHGLPPERVHVAEPGVEHACLAAGTDTGGELLCVAAVTRGKGHDLLLAALATVTGVPWRLACVGPLVNDPAFVERLGQQTRESGIEARVRFTGPLAGPDLDQEYATADVLVLASRAETYAMVVTEALARGLPVISTAVGGVAEALGHAPDGSRPGVLVPPGDPGCLAEAVRHWLEDPGLRRRLRRAARERRAGLPGWSGTSAVVSGVLLEVGR